MAVADEVEVARLVHGDRRQRAVGERFAERVDPVAHVAPIARPEDAIEVHRPVDRTDNPVNRDRPHADIVLTDDAEAIRDLTQWQQRVRSSHGRNYRPLLASAAKAVSRRFRLGTKREIETGTTKRNK